MKSIVLLAVAVLSADRVSAQKEVPLILPEERQALEVQTQAFNDAITPLLSESARSTVRLWSGTRRLAYGTVVGDGSQILSKWSEISNTKGEIIADAGEQESWPAKVVSVYEEEDLVLLSIEGKPLTPVKWSSTAAKLGEFIATPQPDGRLGAFGVVSVLERNLRETDSAFLGIASDPDYQGEGVKIIQVTEKTGAEAAGLKPNDLILKVGDRAISGLLELKNALTGVTPGSRISLLVKSDEREKRVEILLGSRPKSEQFFGERLQQMERMGGQISKVRDSFTRAIQSDMHPNPNQIGGPVVNLKGQVIGITIARADRTRSFIMPASAVVNLLKSDGTDPAIARAREVQSEPTQLAQDVTPRGRGKAGSEERMLRHLSDMQRLMDHLHSEMQQLEGP